MSGNFGIRTDLAVESKEKYEKDNVEIKGVAIQEKYEEALEPEYNGGADSDRAGSESDGKAERYVYYHGSPESDSAG